MIEASASNETRQNAVFPESTIGVAAPIQESAHGVHRLERPVFAVPDDEEDSVSIEDIRIEMQVGIAQDVVFVPLSFEPGLREAILTAEMTVIPVLGTHERVGPDDRPGHPEAHLIGALPSVMRAIEAECRRVSRAVVEPVVSDRLLEALPRRTERRGRISLPCVGRTEERDRAPWAATPPSSR